jgi:hypothetical protein
LKIKFRPSSHSEDYTLIATYKTKAAAKGAFSGVERLLEDMNTNPSDYNTDWGPESAEVSLKGEQVIFSVYSGGSPDDVEAVMKKFKPAKIREYEGFQEIRVTVKIPLKLTMKSAELVLDKQELQVIKWLKKEVGKPDVEVDGEQQSLIWEYRGNGIFDYNEITIPDCELDLDEHPNWKVEYL